MKVLILTNNDIGLYNFRKELLETLIAEKNQVTIALPEGERVKDLIKLGCAYHRIEIDRRGTNPVKDTLLLCRYFFFIKKHRPDIVLTYTVKPNIYGGIAAQLQKVKYIANITGLGTAVESGGWKKIFILFLYRMALKNAACVFFQNKRNQQIFHEHATYHGKERLIPGSGVNVEYHQFEEYPSPDSPQIFLFVGRIMKAKGINEWFEAAEKLKKIYPEIVFQVIGFCEERYEEKLDQMCKNDIIQYLGFQKDVRKFIKKCWALVQPSYHEGLSNVLLEASATGRPVLASRIPGCLETFDEGISGMGFEVKNSKDLADTMERFINLSYEEKKKMGRAAREKVEKEFDRNMIINAYMQEIENAKDRNDESI